MLPHYISSLAKSRARSVSQIAVSDVGLIRSPGGLLTTSTIGQLMDSESRVSRTITRSPLYPEEEMFRKPARLT
jgi:hypothetical protein